MMDSLPYRKRRGHRLPEADPLAPPPQRGSWAWRRATRACRRCSWRWRDRSTSPRILVPGGVTLPPSAGRGCRQDPVDRGQILARRAEPEGRRRTGLPGLRHGRWGLPVPRDGGGLRRSSPRPSACPCPTRRSPPSGQPIWRDIARRSARALVNLANQGPHLGRHPQRCVDPQRDDGPRRVRRLDEPAAPHSGHRLRRRPASGRPSRIGPRSTARRPGWWTSCRTGRATTRRSGPTWPAACPRSCSTSRPSASSSSEAMTVTGEPLGRDARLVGRRAIGGRAPPRTAHSTRTGSTPNDGDHGPRTGPLSRGLTSTVTFPRGNLAPEGFRDQEHGDRPDRRRPRRGLSQDRPGPGLHPREGCDRGDQGTGGRTRSSRATCSC